MPKIELSLKKKLWTSAVSGSKPSFFRCMEHDISKKLGLTQIWSGVALDTTLITYNGVSGLDEISMVFSGGL